MRKILIVEDEKDISFFLKRAFQADLVKEAASLSEALLLDKEFDPHVIILDINLPDGSSLNAIRQFREHTPQAKIILISAANDNLEQEYKAYGAMAFVKKPFTAASIKELVASIPIETKTHS